VGRGVTDGIGQGSHYEKAVENLESYCRGKIVKDLKRSLKRYGDQFAGTLVIIIGTLKLILIMKLMGV